MSLWIRLFGEGTDLDSLQMGSRAVAMFAIALVLVRLAGMRAFGRKSSYDTIIVIMLGAVLSRAVVGASPFLPTVVAGAMLVVVHRLIAMATARSAWFERLIKGRHAVVVHDGVADERVMRRAGISRADLEEATRGQIQRAQLRDGDEIHMESSGDLNVIESGKRA